MVRSWSGGYVAAGIPSKLIRVVNDNDVLAEVCRYSVIRVSLRQHPVMLNVGKTVACFIGRNDMCRHDVASGLMMRPVLVPVVSNLHVST